MITSVPRSAAISTRGAPREWLVPDGRRRICHGHRRRAAHAPLSRSAGRSRRHSGRPPGRAGQPRPGGHPARPARGSELGAHEWSSGVRRPARLRVTWSASTWSTGCPAGGGGSARWSSSGSLPCGTARPALGGGAPAGRRRAGRAGPGRAADLAGRARRAARPTARRRMASGRRRRGGRGRVPVGRPGLGAGGGVVARRARPAKKPTRGLTADEDLWYAGTLRGRAGRPGDTAGCAAWAGRLDDAPPPADEIVATARARNRRVVAGGASRQTTWRPTLALAADAFVVRRRSGRRGRLPVVRRWSRDTMISYEGLFLDTGRPRRAGSCCAAYAATLSEGMLANTADTGRSSTTPSTRRCGSCTRSSRHVDRHRRHRSR